MNDAQPKEWEFSGEPIYLEDNESCWPLPPTISRDRSGPPLDMDYVNTLAPAAAHPESGDSS